jgi:hypothetical protein
MRGQALVRHAYIIQLIQDDVVPALFLAEEP